MLNLSPLPLQPHLSVQDDKGGQAPSTALVPLGAQPTRVSMAAIALFGLQAHTSSQYGAFQGMGVVYTLFPLRAWLPPNPILCSTLSLTLGSPFGVPRLQLVMREPSLLERGFKSCLLAAEQ